MNRISTEDKQSIGELSQGFAAADTGAALLRQAGYFPLQAFGHFLHL
jgi:hypothetical protein